MPPTKRKIEVDATTATVLENRAAEQGKTVAELLADVASSVASPVSVDAAELAELDRRWQAAKRQGGTVGHEDVVAWLRTWGTPAFKPWRQG
jgi:predicted transcriptional regulator